MVRKRYTKAQKPKTDREPTDTQTDGLKDRRGRRGGKADRRRRRQGGVDVQEECV